MKKNVLQKTSSSFHHSTKPSVWGETLKKPLKLFGALKRNGIRTGWINDVGMDISRM